MKLTTLAFLILAAAALGACGGSSNSAGAGPANPEFQNAAPTYDSYSLQMSDSDAVAPAALQAGSAQALTAVAPTADCHPHLFQRTHEVVSRLNRHFNKLLNRINDVIADHPKLKSDTQHVWEKVADGVDRKFTISKTVNADTSITYAFELDARQVAQAAFVTLFSGSVSVSHTAAGAVVEEKGTANYNFDNLQIVYPNAEKASGQITDTFDRLHDATRPGSHVKRSSTIGFTNFLPEEGDVHGPRTGSYAWLGEPGVGGAFSFTDSLVLLCPANPNNLASTVSAVSRWYHPAAGGISGRTDANATGGQIASGDTYLGVTCAQSGTETTPAEGYWMIKLEDATFATVSGQADTSGAAPCDAAFGAVPSVSNNATDYDFASAVSFPGEW